MKINIDQILTEIVFKTSRSSGKGGQHVNKTETRVSIVFNINESSIFSENQKEIILMKLGSRIDSNGNIKIDAEDTRSQLKNKEIACKRLIQLLNESLIIPKTRKVTKPNKAAILKRLKSKKINAEKKKNRGFKL